MSGSKSAKQKPKSKPRKHPAKDRRGFVPRSPLSPDEVGALREFTYYGLGDGRLSWWEENFLNHIKYLLRSEAVWLSDRQQAKVHQLKDKLHYDRQDVPLPPIDPDGVEENDDPDDSPAVPTLVDRFRDDELVDFVVDW